MRNDKISPLRIEVAANSLNDLRRWLQNTRWSYQHGPWISRKGDRKLMQISTPLFP